MQCIAFDEQSWSHCVGRLVAFHTATHWPIVTALREMSDRGTISGDAATEILRSLAALVTRQYPICLTCATPIAVSITVHSKEILTQLICAGAESKLTTPKWLAALADAMVSRIPLSPEIVSASIYARFDKAINAVRCGAEFLDQDFCIKRFFSMSLPELISRVAASTAAAPAAPAAPQ